MTTPTKAENPSAWQGIATAPRDGTQVLLWCPPEQDGDWPAFVVQGWYESGIYDRRWYEVIGENPIVPQPTYWMPLPTPPNALLAQRSKQP